MANRYRGEVALGASGLLLVCGFNALCEVEALFDCPIEDALSRIDRGELGLGELRSLTAILLRHHHPAMTEGEAGEIIGTHFAEAGRAVVEAVRLGVTALEGAPGKKPQRRGTAQGG